MCGICGFAKRKRWNGSVCITDSLSRLRHRGYDSWGTVFMNRDCGNQLTPYRSCGPVTSFQDQLLPDVAASPDVATFQLGHTRYTTQGNHASLDEAQPLISRCGNIALVHNGQIATPPEWSKQSDSLYLLHIIEQEFAGLTVQDVSQRKAHRLIKSALDRVHDRVNGSYACVLLVKGVGMIAFRDRHGIRPLCLTIAPDYFAFASESCAFGGTGEYVCDIPPGQCCWLSTDDDLSIEWDDTGLPRPMGCLFEFIYLAHNDSVIDGLSVADTRIKLGKLLAQPILKSRHQIDAIVPIPHTPLLAGRKIAKLLHIDYLELLRVRSASDSGPNRTFILPGQSARVDAVKRKFELDESLIEKCCGKSILLVDDSIVRGTTLKHIVQLIRERVKPSKIYVASLAPPIIGPNRFGIDIPSTDELIADHKLTHDQNSALVAKKLGVDGPVIYQTLETIEHHFGFRFETSVFRPPSTQTRTIGEILGDQF